MEVDRDLYMVFVDLEKAFDRVPRKVIEYALRKKGVVENMVQAVMEMYEDVEAVVTEEGVRSGVFEVKVGVHQGSVLSPLLFSCVMDVLMEEVRRKEGCRCLLYADDIVLVAESRQQVMEWYREWKVAIEMKGLKINEAKTKGMRCSRQVDVKDSESWPCGVCGKRVGVNSIRCEQCGKWVHGKCAGVSGTLTRVTDYTCRTCQRGGRVMVEPFEMEDARLEGVAEFKYLGDVLADGGGCEQEETTRNRVQAAWWNFKELSGVLCGKTTSLIQKGNLYKACVRTVLGYGAECWALKAEEVRRLVSTERRMLRMMCGVSLKDKVRSSEIGERIGVECIETWMRRQRLRWFGHVKRREEDVEIRKLMELKFVGVGR